MSESNPLLPTGSNNEALFDQKVHRNAFGPSQKIRSTKGMRVVRKHDGIFLVPKVRASSPFQSAPVAAVSIGTLQAIYDNYLVLTDLVSGVNVRVAKQYHLRNSILKEKTLDGTIWTFTYQGTGAGNLAYVARTKTAASGYFEYQRVTKVYQVPIPASGIVGDQIYYISLSQAYANAMNIKTISDDGGATVGTLVTNLEYGPSRQWARKQTQQTP